MPTIPRLHPDADCTGDDKLEQPHASTEMNDFNFDRFDDTISIRRSAAESTGTLLSPVGDTRRWSHQDSLQRFCSFLDSDDELRRSVAETSSAREEEDDNFMLRIRQLVELTAAMPQQLCSLRFQHQLELQRLQKELASFRPGAITRPTIVSSKEVRFPPRTALRKNVKSEELNSHEVGPCWRSMAGDEHVLHNRVSPSHSFSAPSSMNASTSSAMKERSFAHTQSIPEASEEWYCAQHPQGDTADCDADEAYASSEYKSHKSFKSKSNTKSFSGITFNGHHFENAITRRTRNRTPLFDLSMGMLILLNAVVIAVRAQWQGYVNGVQVGLTENDGGWMSAETVFTVLEHMFTVVFTLEIGLRTWLHGLVYFKDIMSLFELLLVIVSILDLYILAPLDLGGSTNLTFLRLARLFKIVRLMRVVRVVALFSSLRVLTQTILSSFTCLLWSMILLGGIMCTAGVFLCQMLSEDILSTDTGKNRRRWLFEHYGTASRSMYTIFEATLSGCWPVYARELVYDVNPCWAIFWVGYVSVVVFAVIRIIGAIFLKETLQNASADADTMIQEQLQKKKAYLSRLEDAFDAIDVEGQGFITRSNFQKLLKIPKVNAYLAVLDFEVHDSEKVFSLLEEDNTNITSAQFLEGVLRMRGAARQIDVIALQYDCRRLMQALTQISEDIGRICGMSSTDSAAHTDRSYLGMMSAGVHEKQIRRSTLGALHRTGSLLDSNLF